jgi:hypothetical protein
MPVTILVGYLPVGLWGRPFLLTAGQARFPHISSRLLFPNSFWLWIADWTQDLLNKIYLYTSKRPENLLERCGGNVDLISENVDDPLTWRTFFVIICFDGMLVAVWLVTLLTKNEERDAIIYQKWQAMTWCGCGSHYPLLIRQLGLQVNYHTSGDPKNLITGWF